MARMAQKDLQNLPSPHKDSSGVRDAESPQSSYDDAVLSIDSGFSNPFIEDPRIKRNANWLDILYHSVTAMVGAGVLGLPAAFSQLGWAGGIIFLVFSFWVSWHTYRLLVYMHEVPDLHQKGGIRRLDRYDQLAEYVWGKGRGKKILLPFQLAVLIGISITYTVVGGENLMAFAESITPHGGASLGKWTYIIIFGGLQLFLSMMPSLHDARLSSLLGTLMSFAYCIIAVAMAATVHPGKEVNYNPQAVDRTSLERAMGVFNALTTVFFAYGGHNVALEIQATIEVNERHPSTVPPMMRGVNWTFLVTGLCYFSVSILGFYAFGTGVADNVLLAFKAGPNHWVVTMANMMVVVHVAAAFQVYTQPVFSLMEMPFKARNRDNEMSIYLQFVLRVTYVILVTVVALVIPFFGALMGLVGAIAVTPTTFLLPPLLWVMYKHPPKWGIDWTVNWALVWVTGVLGVMGAIGALYSIITSWATFKVFAS